MAQGEGPGAPVLVLGSGTPAVEAQVMLTAAVPVAPPLVAVMAQAPSARDVEHWAHGDKTPDAADERRLRDADWVVQTLLQTESAEVVKAWLMGMNPMLDDQAPGLILADDPESVFFAARAYRHGQMGA
jgi:hypothetical protein